MYEKAISDAKVSGESSKVRRYTRALDTIKTLKKKVRLNEAVMCVESTVLQSCCRPFQYTHMLISVLL